MQTKRTQFGVDGQMASLIFHCFFKPFLLKEEFEDTKGR
jgi:hypothetical protein